MLRIKETPIPSATFTGITLNTAPLLFLDFHGVVHRGASGSFERMPLLELWLLDHPSVQVVITSQWRIEHDLHWLKNCFGFEELHSRVLGVTPEILTITNHRRQAEIEMWLRNENRQDSPKVAL